MLKSQGLGRKRSGGEAQDTCKYPKLSAGKEEIYSPSPILCSSIFPCHPNQSSWSTEKGHKCSCSALWENSTLLSIRDKMTSRDTQSHILLTRNHMEYFSYHHSACTQIQTPLGEIVPGTGVWRAGISSDRTNKAMDAICLEDLWKDSLVYLALKEFELFVLMGWRCFSKQKLNCTDLKCFSLYLFLLEIFVKKN